MSQTGTCLTPQVESTIPVPLPAFADSEKDTLDVENNAQGTGTG